MLPEHPGGSRREERRHDLCPYTSPLGKGSAVLIWRTNFELDIVGYNVLVFDNKGNRTQLNPTLIPCEGCVTCAPFPCTYLIPKHKSGRNVFVEVVRRGGTTFVFGPAVRTD